MNILPHSVRSAGLLFLLGGAVLVPSSVAAQVLSVSPTSVSVSANAGTDAPSQSVQIRNNGRGALKWTVTASSSWLSVSPASGTNSGTLTLTFRTASLAAGQYHTSFTVESNGGSQTVSVQATIGSAESGGGGSGTGGTGTATISVSSTTLAPGSQVTVSFSNPNPTSTDWIALSRSGSSVYEYLEWKFTSSCTHTAGTAMASGSCTFTAPSEGGTYEFRLFGDSYTLLSSVTVNVTSSSSPSPSPAPAPSSSGYGPQSTITCPAGAVDIWPGAHIQTIVNSHVGNTTFCLRAGTHALNYSIVPKTGNTFVGEHGAILDGSNWSTSDDTAAAFRAHNQDIDYVTIRNLVIRRMPQRGIHAFYWMSNNWTVEHNEISHAKWALVFPPHSTIRNNRIHSNSAGGYLGTYSHNSLIEGNEIAYNGWEQKVGESSNVTFRNNFVHSNNGDGIWFDSNNTGILIEGNRVEDNGQAGIFYEISSGGTIRNNTIRRNRGIGVFISTSKDSQIYGNTLENNFRGILYFVNCSSVGGGTIGFDLANNSAYSNTIVVGTQTDAFASGFSWTLCSSTQVAPYLNGSKNLRFSGNAYQVPSATTGRYWLWNGLKNWSEWLNLGQDTNGSVR
jgi:parallel beta-helix repeat protein